LQTVLIVGASAAGARAAETLRNEGFAGKITLVGAEPERPYERPPLSKEILLGRMPEEKLYFRPAEFYADQAIDLRLGERAVHLDAPGHAVVLAGGERLPYDHLLIATGATPRRLAVPGGDLDGIVYLRSVADARGLRARLEGARRVAVVGMGFIGAEVAAACRTLGLEVVALEALPVPLLGALGPTVGEIYAGIHRDHGVDLRTATSVAAFRGSGQVAEVVTSAGDTVACDLALVGVGVAPETTWLEGSGLALDDGVLVDELCRTNLEGVYAAGDVARWWHPGLGLRLRVEHFDNAGNQGAAAARSLLGRGEPYAPLLYFWSDQYDLSLQYVGHASGADEVVLRGSPPDASWSAFYVRDSFVRAALAVNRFKDVGAARQLITRRVPITAAQLADPDTDLRALAQPPR
jgi:3-phenylpropionate/trans-cinnamate dioxygenase ferredoxin reductase subunit